MQTHFYTPLSSPGWGTMVTQIQCFRARQAFRPGCQRQWPCSLPNSTHLCEIVHFPLKELKWHLIVTSAIKTSFRHLKNNLAPDFKGPPIRSCGPFREWDNIVIGVKGGWGGTGSWSNPGKINLPVLSRGPAIPLWCGLYIQNLTCDSLNHSHFSHQCPWRQICAVSYSKK